TPAKVDDDLEKLINERRQQLENEKSLKCPSCDQVVSEGAQFCSHCGEAL
ncbi:MAG TPA: zinc-ribbon domain-containing protein, partial [Chloroflexi bacterium]|nr:zinc-ribbon domain-containing protein [Chloroflexota bacterium]